MFSVCVALTYLGTVAKMQATATVFVRYCAHLNELFYQRAFSASLVMGSIGGSKVGLCGMRCALNNLVQAGQGRRRSEGL